MMAKGTEGRDVYKRQSHGFCTNRASRFLWFRSLAGSGPSSSIRRAQRCTLCANILAPIVWASLRNSSSRARIAAATRGLASTRPSVRTAQVDTSPARHAAVTLGTSPASRAVLARANASASERWATWRTMILADP